MLRVEKNGMFIFYAICLQEYLIYVIPLCVFFCGKYVIHARRMKYVRSFLLVQCGHVIRRFLHASDTLSIYFTTLHTY